MTSQVTAVPDLSFGAGKKHVKRDFWVQVCNCACVPMYRVGCVSVCVSLGVVCDSIYVSVYLRISWSPSSQGSVYLRIGGLPKQCIFYS